MASDVVMMEDDPSWQDVMELIRELKRSADLQKQLTDKLEKAIHRHPRKDDQGKACMETSRYVSGAYMPDYILDERGFIVDVIPDSVRVPYRRKDSDEPDGEDADKKQ
ncbi:MAG: hypothetical protein K6E18_06515 [Lachnospiraceae bacterium]|nr:hypothetical protein [Lachnospiraceae bacterium]